MTKHTPGPWRYARDKDDGPYSPHSYVWGPSVTIQTSGNLDRNEPDMRLIAATPDLLEACLRVERAYRLGESISPNDAAFLGAAIAKATGAE